MTVGKSQSHSDQAQQPKVDDLNASGEINNSKQFKSRKSKNSSPKILTLKAQKRGRPESSSMNYIKEEVISVRTSDEEPLFNSRSGSYLAMQSHLREVQGMGHDTEFLSYYDRVFSYQQDNNSFWTKMEEGTPLSAQKQAIQQNLKQSLKQKSQMRSTLSSSKSQVSCANVSEPHTQKRNFSKTIHNKDMNQDSKVPRRVQTQKVDYLKKKTFVGGTAGGETNSGSASPSVRMASGQQATAANDSQQSNQLRPPLGPFSSKKSVSKFYSGQPSQQLTGKSNLNFGLPKYNINRHNTCKDNIYTHQIKQRQVDLADAPLNTDQNQCQYFKFQTQVGGLSQKKNLVVQNRSQSKAQGINDDAASKSSQIFNPMSNLTMSNMLKQLSSSRSNSSCNAQVLASSREIKIEQNTPIIKVYNMQTLAGHQSPPQLTQQTTPRGQTKRHGEFSVKTHQTPITRIRSSKKAKIDKSLDQLKKQTQVPNHLTNVSSDNVGFLTQGRKKRMTKVLSQKSMRTFRHSAARSHSTGKMAIPTKELERNRKTSQELGKPLHRNLILDLGINPTQRAKIQEQNRRSHHATSLVTHPMQNSFISQLSRSSNCIQQSCSQLDIPNNVVDGGIINQTTQRIMARALLGNNAQSKLRLQKNKTDLQSPERHSCLNANRNTSTLSFKQSNSALQPGSICLTTSTIAQPQTTLFGVPSNKQLQQTEETLQFQLQQMKKLYNKIKTKNGKLLARIGYLTKEVADRDKLMQKFILNNETETKVKESCVLQSYKSKLASVERIQEQLKKKNSALVKSEEILKGQLTQLQAEKELLHNECVKMSQKILIEQHERRRQMQADDQPQPSMVYSTPVRSAAHVHDNKEIINIETVRPSTVRPSTFAQQSRSTTQSRHQISQEDREQRDSGQKSNQRSKTTRKNSEEYQFDNSAAAITHRLGLMLLQEMHDRRKALQINQQDQRRQNIPKMQSVICETDDLIRCTEVSEESEDAAAAAFNAPEDHERAIDINQSEVQIGSEEDSREQKARKTTFYLGQLKQQIIEQETTIREFKRELQRLYAPKVKIILQIKTLQDEAAWKATSKDPRANVERAKACLRDLFYLGEKIFDDSFFKTFMRNFEPVFSNEATKMTQKVYDALVNAQLKSNKKHKTGDFDNFDKLNSSVHRVVSIQDLHSDDAKLIQFARYMAHQTLRSEENLSIEISSGSEPNNVAASFQLSECIKNLATQNTTLESEKIDETHTNSLLSKLYDSSALDVFFSTLKTQKVLKVNDQMPQNATQHSFYQEYKKQGNLDGVTKAKPILIDCTTFRSILGKFVESVQEERAAEHLVNIMKLRTLCTNMVDLAELYRILTNEPDQNDVNHNQMVTQNE